jgi:hypothetical protein
MSEAAMTSTSQHAHDSLDILIDELMMDDELLRSFLRDPERTLRRASDWGLPLSDSELQALQAPAFRLWDRVTEELESRFAAAA